MFNASNNVREREPPIVCAEVHTIDEGCILYILSYHPMCNNSCETSWYTYI